MTGTLSIRQMCETFEVTPRALRFYEQKELLFPLRMGTRRLYNKRDRARLTLILRGKKFGFALEDIRQLLELYDREGSESQMRRALALAEDRLEGMLAARAELDATIRDLQNEIASCESLLSDRCEAAE